MLVLCIICIIIAVSVFVYTRMNSSIPVDDAAILKMYDLSEQQKIHTINVDVQDNTEVVKDPSAYNIQV